MKDFAWEASQERPDHTFIQAPASSLTFAEAETRVASMAGALKDLGVASGDRVAVWASNQIPSVLAMFAIWRIGATCELVNTRLTESEVFAQIQRARSHLIVGINPPKIGIPIVDPVTLMGDPVAASTIDPAGTALIIHTSGSSGGPKGVRLTFANLDASAASCSAHLHQTPEDRWLAVLPLSHIGGASIMIRCIRRAVTAVLEPGFQPERTARLIADGEVTLGSMVPAMLRRVLDANPGPYHGMRALLLGGGSVPEDLCSRAAAAGIPVLPTYGMTETASQVATARLSDAYGPRWRMTVVPGAQMRSIEGRLQVRGPMVSPGYLGEADRRPADWFVTSDLGEVDEFGVVKVFGRVDNVIVTGGENVFPAEVEDVIQSHPDVTEAVVIGVPHPGWGTQVVAVFSGPASIEELDRYARMRLAGFKVPKRWVRLERIPRIGPDKPDRQLLVEMLTKR